MDLLVCVLLTYKGHSSFLCARTLKGTVSHSSLEAQWDKTLTFLWFGWECFIMYSLLGISISWHWLLGQSWANLPCQCAGEIALGVQSGPWHSHLCRQGLPQHVVVPSLNPSIHLLPHQHQVHGISRPPQAAASHRSPPRIPSANTRLQEDTGTLQHTRSPPRFQCPIKHRLSTGIHIWPQIQFGFTVPFQNGGCSVPPTSWRKRGRFGGFYGKARNRAEQCCAGAD